MGHLFASTIVIACSIALAFDAFAKPPPKEVPKADRYDHAAHEAMISKKNGKNPACNACHKLDEKSGWAQKLPVGKAGGVHTPCSNSGCHQDVYAKFKKARDTPFCFTCHVERLGKELVFPPYRERGAGDFYLPKFGHKEHIREGNKGCPQCHAPLLRPIAGSTKEMTRVSHDRCGNKICHGEASPPLMASCEGCHARKGSSSTPVEMFSSSTKGNLARVRKLFSHPEHKKKSPKDDCSKCHVNVGVERGVRVPLPPMIACESCHDAKAAFSALGTECRRCHLGPEKSFDKTLDKLPDPLMAAAPFGHKQHEKAGLKLECASCHGSSPDGQLKVPSKNHKPCSDEKCHARDYRKLETKLCYTCHANNAPWKPMPLKPTFKLPPGALSEFFVGFSHKAHLDRGDAKMAAAKSECSSCHFDQVGAKAPQIAAGHLAPSHVLCASCHAKDAKPYMPECGNCHGFENFTAGNAAAAKDPNNKDVWRVVRKFPHLLHLSDVRTAKENAKETKKDSFGWARYDKSTASSLRCEQCHAGVIQASVGQRPPRPTMLGCMTCHNGALSFRATGHECARCHGEPAS